MSPLLLVGLLLFCLPVALLSVEAKRSARGLAACLQICLTVPTYRRPCPRSPGSFGGSPRWSSRIAVSRRVVPRTLGGISQPGGPRDLRRARRAHRAASGQASGRRLPFAGTDGLHGCDRRLPRRSLASRSHAGVLARVRATRPISRRRPGVGCRSTRASRRWHSCAAALVYGVLPSATHRLGGVFALPWSSRLRWRTSQWRGLCSCSPTSWKARARGARCWASCCRPAPRFFHSRCLGFSSGGCTSRSDRR